MAKRFMSRKKEGETSCENQQKKGGTHGRSRQSLREESSLRGGEAFPLFLQREGSLQSMGGKKKGIVPFLKIYYE